MLRPFLSQFPADSTTRREIGLPWGACISPLAPCPKQNSDLHLLDDQAKGAVLEARATSASELPRCGSCGAYLSRLCRIDHAGWRCFLCGDSNTLPSRYFSALTYRAEDIFEHVPELHSSLYEVPISSNTISHSHAYIFLVRQCQYHGFWSSVTTALQEILSALSNDALVGFVSFTDEKVSFLDHRGYTWRRYDLNSFNNEHDNEHDNEPSHFSPVGTWLQATNAISSRMRLLDALWRISREDPDSSQSTDALLSAINAILGALKSCCVHVSRVSCFSHIDTPSALHAHTVLTIQDDVISETEVLNPETRQEKSTNRALQVGTRALSANSVVDFYILNDAHDIASLPISACVETVSIMSGGSIIMDDRNDHQLPQLLRDRLEQAVAVAAHLRVRTSADFRLREVFGPSIHRDPELHEIFCITAGYGPSSTFVADFEFANLDGFINSAQAPAMQLAFQAIVLRPRCPPCNILRIHSSVVAVSASPSIIWKSADVKAIGSYLFHKAAAIVAESGPASARDFLFNQLVGYTTGVLESDRAANTDGNRASQTSSNTSGLLTDRLVSSNSKLDELARFTYAVLRSCKLEEDHFKSDHGTYTLGALERLDPDELWVRVMNMYRSSDNDAKLVAKVPPPNDVDLPFNRFLQEISDVAFLSIGTEHL